MYIYICIYLYIYRVVTELTTRLLGIVVNFREKPYGYSETYCWHDPTVYLATGIVRAKWVRYVPGSFVNHSNTMCISYANHMWIVCESYMIHMHTICTLYGSHMWIICNTYVSIEIICAYIYKSYAHRIPFAYANQVHCVYMYANHMRMSGICTSFVYILNSRHIAYANYIQIPWDLHMICISYTLHIYKSCADPLRFVYDLHMHIQITWLFLIENLR